MKRAAGSFVSYIVSMKYVRVAGGERQYRSGSGRRRGGGGGAAARRRRRGAPACAAAASAPPTRRTSRTGLSRTAPLPKIHAIRSLSLL